MSDKVPQHKNFDNRYDNADLQVDRTAKDIAAGYTEFDEMKAYKLYLETLEVESRVSASTEKVKSQRILRSRNLFPCNPNLSKQDAG